MRLYGKSGVARLMAGVAAGAIIMGASTAWAQSKSITVEPQPLMSALHDFGSQTGVQILYAPEILKSKVSSGVVGAQDEQFALTTILAGTGLTFRREANAYVIVQQEGGSGPQGTSGAGAAAEVEALIVTAQKREEAIQDVPIAISAFTQKALEEQKIEGGFDLLKAIPNVTFSKSNFSGYNFSIRGVGTKAVSATTDQGVAVAYNNTTLIHNRLFEQEYFDVERVEVLRGPQGTLYGRNATSGVINVISAKPKLHQFEASLKAEVGNYDAKRLVGMVNLPIIDDMLAIRIAGAGTRRTGYDFNEITGNNINGRDLWSGRITVGFEPTERIRANLIWDHFEEDDDRSRTSKQLCHRDDGPTHIGSAPVTSGPYQGERHELWATTMMPAAFSQACKAGSLYDEAAFGTPNGLALPFVFAPLMLGAQVTPAGSVVLGLGRDPTTGYAETAIKLADPYGGLMQSRDLRTIASVHDPRYRAKADVYQFNFEFDLTDSLTLTSQTAWNEDEVYSFQDFNRFNSFPIFHDTSTFTHLAGGTAPSPFINLAPGGVFCDPQLGCSDRLTAFDISQSVSTQFNQEFRLSSNFDGPVNFSAGVNYTEFETLIDYYVFYNLITVLALTPPFYRPENFEIDLTTCYESGAFNYPLGSGAGPVPAGDPTAVCPYIDPNPLESINGEGHNYFRSKNPYDLKSIAGFGEIYWNVTEALKLTAGLRYTDDRKRFVPVPSQVLLAPGFIAGGTVSRGAPEKPAIVQQWGEFTGRIGVDWKPILDFTDDTMVYAFYSRGYKGGGANPPTPGFATTDELIAYFEAVGMVPNVINRYRGPNAEGVLSLTAVDYGPTFEPEFVNAFELGAKNTLLRGALTFNATAFYYDYRDYQVSQIKDRTAVNENFDAKIWGLEFETVFAPSRDFRINANIGLLDTEIADGETSIDIMNRTQGDPNYTLVKPWVQMPSNCVLPTHVIENWLITAPAIPFFAFCGGFNGALSGFNPTFPFDPAFGNSRYDHRNYPELNGGAGLRAQLGGNELPNAPHITTNIGVQYGRHILDGSWRVTVRSDAYWQSQSWARVYNAVNDKLHGWYNLNLGVTLANEYLGVQAEFYVKNLLDKSPITDAFLNSDDTGLTTNVFVLDPRLVGLSLRKTF